MFPLMFRNVSTLLWIAFLLTGNGTIGSGQDLITIVDDKSGVVSQFQGQVLSWDSEKLKYVNSGQDREIPARRVSRIDYAKTPEQQQADQYFASAQFDQASLVCEQAIARESRPWVIEDIRALKLQCAAATGNVEQAVVEFLEILKLSPKTRFLHLMPLAWHSSQRAGGSLALELRNWLDRDDPVRGLIGASWLLMSDAEQATKRLRELQIAGDSQMAQLAAAQLWRDELITADENELRRWQASIDRMPESIQAGPRYLVAVVQKRLAPGENSAVALLQIPILFPEQYQVAGEALGEAYSLLKALGRNDDAAIVSRELHQKFGFSASALRSQNSMEQFGK